jgi:hypothetical protein
VGESHTVFVSRSCRIDVSEREYKLAEILPLEDLQTSHGQRLQHASNFMIDLKEKYEAYSFRSKDSP